MATARVAFYAVGLANSVGSNTLGVCLLAETVDFTSEAFSTNAAPATNRDVVVRITAIDAACYFATGTTPDADATAASGVTSAADVLTSGASVELAVAAGSKVALKAVS